MILIWLPKTHLGLSWPGSTKKMAQIDFKPQYWPKFWKSYLPSKLAVLIYGRCMYLFATCYLFVWIVLHCVFINEQLSMPLDDLEKVFFIFFLSSLKCCPFYLFIFVRNWTCAALFVVLFLFSPHCSFSNDKF